MEHSAKTEAKQHHEPQAHEPVGPQIQTWQPEYDPNSLVARSRLDPGQMSPSDVIHLQRMVGNRAVSQMLAASRPGAGPIQAKLTVSPAGDRYEQEADRVAEQVMSEPASQRTSEERRPGGRPPGVQRQEEEEEIQAMPLVASITPLVQRRGEGGFDAGLALETRLSASRGAGSPLPHNVRAFMEQRLGADFNKVRLHADPEAAQMSRDLSAQAFTAGQDVYLGAAAPQPASAGGQRLLAHELTHVVQQTGPGANVVQRVIKVNGKISRPTRSNPAEQAIVKNWIASRIEHNFAGRTSDQATKALDRAIQDAATHGKVAPPLFCANNLKFLTQDPSRLPTLYFKSGNESGRIRQQHPSGPAVITQVNKIDYFFPAQATSDSFYDKAKQAMKDSQVFPRDPRRYTGARPEPAFGDYHIEVTYKSDGKIQKIHPSGGKAQPDVKDYHDWQIDLIYQRAIGKIANLRVTE